MEIDEKSIRFLEEHIPELADAAVKQAYWRTLAAGHCVLIRDKESLVEVHPDGTRKIIKKLPPLTSVKKGSISRIHE